MGWKAFKEHYDIGHHVAFFEGEGLCIGTGFIHGIIVIDPQERKITTCRSSSPGNFSNGDLNRYWAEIHMDLDLMWELIAAEDRFETSLPVYTYESGAVVQYFCEKYGYPNVTHDGQMMYENTFFESEKDARSAGIRNARAGIEALESAVGRAEKDLAERRDRLDEYRTDLAKLLPAV